MATPKVHWLLPVVVVSFLACVLARRGQDMRCGACRALVDEVEWEISQVNPKKTIKKGSFRINPDGSQSVIEAPYARSETHLIELLEHVCEKMTEYGEKIDPDRDRKTYVRVLSRDGKQLDASATNIEKEVIDNLKATCEHIVEVHEDELLEFFSHETENVKDKLCSTRTDLCDNTVHITHDEL
ncbi:PREDICTED: protein canopy homolog 2 [Nanorana parkeri]|uniref:protein canopy homolog 2 n=1 Tax=Nanorana parkeri TaxID=125878 RepID=UPI0008548A23|nr:PREDICTED: protein canopy homolog 2 [Nanorana parkeri]